MLYDFQTVNIDGNSKFKLLEWTWENVKIYKFYKTIQIGKLIPFCKLIFYLKQYIYERIFVLYKQCKYFKA